MKAYSIYVMILLAGLFSCSKMDDNYKGFIKGGEIVYAGSADSVKTWPGNKRLQLTWLLSDPTVTSGKIYWNNSNDSMDLVFKRQHEIDTIKLILSPLQEGQYSFDIFTFDSKGNKSIKVTTTGQVYGDRYLASLLPRPVRSALYMNGVLNITWGTPDSHVSGTEIKYRDRSGAEKLISVPADSNTTTIDTYEYTENNPILYSTVYLPDSNAIDLFKTPFEEIAVKGPPMEYAKTGWTATASDYDEPSGRGPANAIDNNVSTVWHMSKAAGSNYPHTIKVDMGTVNEVAGFTFNQRLPLDGAVKLIEIEISNDNASWRSLGAFTLLSVNDKQYLDLTETESFRYFRVIIRSDYKNSTFTALAEVGTYKR
ncbi:hypothetical protein J2T02_002680 [Chitinophaga terrae (ex Kim and Jung 2007)]|uniref:DUF4998 domain-containing protein n=1 Tax=Chitinophaga terrae (ex Kim and Jung 2007) TaxID=408074 RepID=UPI002782D5FC|nr:DUF4998 domain-containing protein [Chitinophaga terrae (ex Kim and Jung 2007)]MDQ0107561.1 hypothetical protein [Chitinophaga terrae (ex Kim and Jung 2007)]